MQKEKIERLEVPREKALRALKEKCNLGEIEIPYENIKEIIDDLYEKYNIPKNKKNEDELNLAFEEREKVVKYLYELASDDEIISKQAVEDIEEWYDERD